MKILVVEDSPRLRRALTEGLHRSGFVFDMAEDGIEGLGFATTYEYDVIVLDLMLPRLDGLSLLKKLRNEQIHAQVLILSARDGVDDRVRGLELGADDYLVKPFAFEELVARIKTLVRRRHEITQSEFSIGQLSLDTVGHRASCKDVELRLTPGEYNLLEYLVMRRGRVISKGQLQDVLSGAGSEVTSNVVEVWVSNIRKKAGVADVIRTRRGFGYYVE
jgi:two-component system copper resistance phosphate regulon response regulator CusR